MTISYNLRPNPIWYIADLVGRPLAAGKMYTKSNLNKSVDKAVYTDPAGAFPWTNPIIFAENGSQGPFYFEFDSDNPDELYYLEVYDENDALVWTIDNFSGGGGSGGGNITTTIDTTNYIVNGQFWRNIGTSGPPLAGDILLAPGAHSGFSFNQTDIRFHKDNLSATDRIRFLPFFPTDTNALTGDVTPEYYLDYECSVAGVGETEKYVEIPITSQVQNLQNQDVTIVIWAKSFTGTPQLGVSQRTFYGDGTGASPQDLIPITTLTLGTVNWTKHVIQTTTTAIAGKSIGTCGNSAYFLRFSYPLDAALQIGFTKPALYLGHITPDEAFDTHDQTDAIISSPHTGDIRISYNGQNNFGWLAMNDGTIGSATSGATSRANIDTFPLYAMLYVNVIDTYAPVSGGRTAPGTTFANAVTDFGLNKPLALTKSLGRAMAGIGIPSSGGSGTSWALGQTFGAETHTLTIEEMPPHNHPGSTAPATTNDTGGGNFEESNGALNNLPLNIASQGGLLGVTQPHNIVQPTVHTNVYIKL